MFDLVRQLKRPLAMCSNDAKSCYDRIVHSVASLCIRRMGSEEPPIVCMFTTIHTIHHSIRTVYDDSELTFTGDFLLSRANNQLLIPLFHETEIRDDQLHRLNVCRLFLQVLTISYITTGCDTKIIKAAWNRDTHFLLPMALAGTTNYSGLDTVANMLDKGSQSSVGQ
jgi:hypothetical protein